VCQGGTRHWLRESGGPRARQGLLVRNHGEKSVRARDEHCQTQHGCGQPPTAAPAVGHHAWRQMVPGRPHLTGVTFGLAAATTCWALGAADRASSTAASRALAGGAILLGGSLSDRA